MVWQELEKDSAGAGFTIHVGLHAHVEEFLTPTRRNKGEGLKLTKDRTKSRLKKFKGSAGTASQGVGLNSIKCSDKLGEKRGEMEQVGKRKKQGQPSDETKFEFKMLK
jgi:hypothetical protein